MLDRIIVVLKSVSGNIIPSPTRRYLQAHYEVQVSEAFSNGHFRAEFFVRRTVTKF
jgi:hypothetical protein